MRVLATIIMVMVIVILAWYGLHTWYVDTHCTMFLGSQVCQ